MYFQALLDLNDAFLYPSLTEYPPVGWCKLPYGEIDAKSCLGLFDSHRLPLSCGASTPSCRFDEDTGMLVVAGELEKNM